MNNKNEEMKESLFHYGILGMKWGKRKVRKTSGSKKRKKESVKSLSDDELRKRINRMQMEQQYKQLSTAKVTEGKKKAQNTLKTIGKITVKSVAIAGVFGGAKYLGKKYGLDEKQTLNLDRTMKIATILGQG